MTTDNILVFVVEDTSLILLDIEDALHSARAQFQPADNLRHQHIRGGLAIAECPKKQSYRQDFCQRANHHCNVAVAQ
jgi:hypothetical protein